MRKGPPSIHIVCICWRQKEDFQAFLVPLGPASICTHTSTQANPPMHRNFFFYLSTCYQVFIFFSSGTLSFSQLHADPVLILKPSAYMKFLCTSLKRSHRRKQLKGQGQERGRLEIQNSMKQCNCPLHLRSDKPDKENWSLHVQIGLTPCFVVDGSQTSELWDTQDITVKLCCPLTPFVAMNPYELCNEGRMPSTPDFGYDISQYYNTWEYMPHDSDLARYLFHKNPWEYSSMFEGSQVCLGGAHVLCNPTALAIAKVPAIWKPLACSHFHL